ncbi:hypothetical protein OIU77_014638 [Salix suchowensis]|uniref:Uncharacterized protein n=1 Tax=Salix suchowensis TaxID=1278906 RepID=A0ABQ8ZY57_9ROSI|nr:hypothetical protein OIU77_014638 [Salix suchowensis]
MTLLNKRKPYFIFFSNQHSTREKTRQIKIFIITLEATSKFEEV